MVKYTINGIVYDGNDHSVVKEFYKPTSDQKAVSKVAATSLFRYPDFKKNSTDFKYRFSTDRALIDVSTALWDVIGDKTE